MPRMQKRWNILEAPPEEFIASCDGLHPAVARLLWHRNIRTPQEIGAFLRPSFDEHAHDPFLFSQMEEAVARILSALEKGERIVVFGDYDADGLTGSATIITTLRQVREALYPSAEDRVGFYIPHRDKEGYGLQMSQAERFATDGTQLVITVDCGISCVAEVAHLRAHGVDVVIVDHHQFGEVLPDAITIHPSIPGETYPFPLLAAVGVAWKVASALIMKARAMGANLPEGCEKWLLDLVAIATVTDIVPLIGENRVLERYGLMVLNKTRRPGLRALIGTSGLTLGAITARDIGFVIGPRLNAPSRMDHAGIGLELLTAEKDDDAFRLANELEALNRARQEATALMMREADDLLTSFPEDAALHVLWRDDWSPALVGLVAGRVADRFGVPVIAIGKHGGQWIGSGRSIPSYNITEAVKRAGEGILTRSGGHSQACGFAFTEDDALPIFADRLRQDAANLIDRSVLGPTMEIHADVGLREIDWKLLDDLACLEPYGAQNPAPVFIVRNAEVVSSSTVGKDGKHLRLLLRSSDSPPRAFIAFGFGHRVSETMHRTRLDVVCTISPSEWNGKRDIQCKVVDFRQAGEG